MATSEVTAKRPSGKGRTPPGQPTLSELRDAARGVGATQFDPGILCIRGHSDLRTTANMECIACRRLRMPSCKLDPVKRKARQQRADAKRAGPKRRADKRAWEAKNRERLADKKQVWKAANPERWSKSACARGKRWRDKNPEAVCALAARRRAKKRAAPAGDPRARVAYDRWARTRASLPCYWCRLPTKRGARHVDHIIPLAKGGSDAVANLCVSCPSCNSRKKAQMPHEFAGQAEMSFR